MDSKDCFIKLNMGTGWEENYISADDFGKISLEELIDGIDLNRLPPDIQTDHKETSTLDMAPKEEYITPGDAVVNADEFNAWVEQNPELAIQLALKEQDMLETPTERIAAAAGKITAKDEYFGQKPWANFLLEKYFRTLIPAIRRTASGMSPKEARSGYGALSETPPLVIDEDVKKYSPPDWESPPLVIDLKEEVKKYSPPDWESPSLVIDVKEGANKYSPPLWESPPQIVRPHDEPARVVVKDKEKVLTSAKVYGVDPAKIKVNEAWVARKKCVRRTKQAVPANEKTPEYWARRLKNTEAARRSRDKRRIIENAFILRTLYLEEKYEELQKKLLEVMTQKVYKKAFSLVCS